MHITRDSITDHNSFENLVIQESKIGEEDIVSIFKYTPSSILPSADNSFVYNGLIQKTDLSSINQTLNSGSDGCSSYVLMCNQAWDGSGVGNAHIAGPHCNNINFLFIKKIQVLCDDYSAPINNNAGGGTYSGGSGNPNGNNNYTIPDTNNVITNPVLGNNFISNENPNPQQLFYTELSDLQQDWADNNPEAYDDLINYLIENEWSSESEVFASNVLNEIISNSNTENLLSSSVTIVNSNQSNQISDIEDYLKCFALNQSATFTLYVDQPTANSNESWSGFPHSPDVGHTFISIRQGSIRRVLGFYPSFAVDLDNPSTAGVCENNSAHEYDVAISFSISPTKLNNLINYIKNSANGQYNLNSNNCTDFGMACARITGLPLPSAYGTWGMPGVGSGGGDNPGQLGQNIRNLSTMPSDSVRTTTTGNAASNAGTCN